MNRKYQAWRLEILSFLGCDPHSADTVTLPPAVDGRVLEPDARLKRQARLYGLWERAKQFGPGTLSDREHQELAAIQEHLELCLGELGTPLEDLDG